MRGANSLGNRHRSVLMARMNWRVPWSPCGHHSGNRMLENQLLLIVRFEHERVFVKAPDAARELDTAQEVDCDHSFFFARIIEKAVLNVLRWLVHLQVSG